MKAIHKKRLLKLAKHLRSGKLGHKKFNFAKINANLTGLEIYSNGCGAIGCAIGECPIAFPDDWEFRDGRPIVNGFKKSTDDCFESAERFFGLTEDQSSHLFAPQCQQPRRYGGVDLDSFATAKQVAANIEAFVRRKEKGGK